MESSFSCCLCTTLVSSLSGGSSAEDSDASVSCSSSDVQLLSSIPSSLTSDSALLRTYIYIFFCGGVESEDQTSGPSPKLCLTGLISPPLAFRTAVCVFDSVREGAASLRSRFHSLVTELLTVGEQGPLPPYGLVILKEEDEKSRGGPPPQIWSRLKPR